MSTLEFFSSPAGMTLPGRNTALLDDLPADVTALYHIVQGLMIHIYWTDHYGILHSPTLQADANLRSVPQQLARILELDPRPLAEARPLKKKIIGNCRDFSLLLVV